MSTFVRLAAVLVGLTNAIVYSMVADAPIDEGLSLAPVPWPIAAALLTCAVLAGLLVSEVLLRFKRPGFQGSFSIRYLVMALAVFAGGMVMGALIPFIGLFDSSTLLMNRIARSLFFLPFSVAIGGVLGIMEGLVLAFPLAAILDRFRTAG